MKKVIIIIGLIMTLVSCSSKYQMSSCPSYSSVENINKENYEIRNWINNN